MNDFKIDYLDDISKYSGIFNYGTSTNYDNLKFYISLKISSSRYFVCDFIDKQPDGKLVFRDLKHHIYHKIKFEKILNGAFVDPITNHRISIKKFYEIIQTLKHNKNYNNILYIDNKNINENDISIIANFYLAFDKNKKQVWKATFYKTTQVPFSFYIDSLLNSYNQFLNIKDV